MLTFLYCLHSLLNEMEKAELKWLSGVQCMLCSPHRQSLVRALAWTSTNACGHLLAQTCLQVCGLKRLWCHADLHTVSRCYTRGESQDHTDEKTCKRDPPWLWNPGQTSQGYQSSHDFCPPNFFLKSEIEKSITLIFTESTITIVNLIWN